MKCQLCKEEVFLPYKCSYCGQYFCDDHRLPEQHQCPGLPKRGWGTSVRVSTKTHDKKKIRPLPTASEDDSVRVDAQIEEKEKIKPLPASANDTTYPSKISKPILNVKRRMFIKSLTKKIKLNTISIINLAFLIIISLPVFDSIQLMWDSPLTFSRTFLPKWWDLFPSEYPIPSINLLYVYFGMLGLYLYILLKFMSKSQYKTYDPRKRRLRHYYYVILIGVMFLFFFSEANFFWISTVQKTFQYYLGGLTN